jgi:hypothetical protein
MEAQLQYSVSQQMMQASSSQKAAPVDLYAFG